MKDIIQKIAEKYISDLILTSEPLMPKWNRENYIFKKEPKWNYMDSCIIRALLMYGEPRYIVYAERFVSSYVTENGDIPTMRAADYNLDNLCGGVNLIKLYELTGEPRYKLAYEKIYREQVRNQPRLKCGSFWHKAIYPEQMWLDGAYMALPFLAMYGKKTGDEGIVRDAVEQALNIKKHMRDESTGLYYHGYNESRTMFWADSRGLSREFWLRSNGWLCAGLAELYEITREPAVGGMLSELADSLSRCLTDEGMLLQLPIRRELAGNYPETSGTLLFAYGAMKGARLGTVGEGTAACGKTALEAVAERYIVWEGGQPVLKNICLMGGLGGADSRDGSAEYYLSERVVENEAKGIAPYLMAAYEYD